MKVVEIFKSIDGEGIRTGCPVTFIRLHGCNLRCGYCDTKYSYGDNPYMEMTVDEIIEKVNELEVKRITLTGGEPLIHEDVYELIRGLVMNGYEVNIETNGSISLKNLWLYRNSVEYSLSPGTILITVDYKSVSSEMCKYNILGNAKYVESYDVYKFVVGSTEDLDNMKDIINRLNLCDRCCVYVSPVFGKIEPKAIVDYVLENKLYDVVVQVQLHKIIWNPNERGV